MLGQYVAYHNYSTRVYADYDGELNTYKIDGRNPARGGYIPRLRVLHRQETDSLRGYATGFGASRSTYQDTSSTGKDLRDNLLNPKLGHWWVGAQMMGETIPKSENRVYFDGNDHDVWGVPFAQYSHRI